MSFWTDLRDGIEAFGSVVLNYFYPGAGAVASMFVSEGAQDLLRPGGKTGYLGSLAMMGSGIAGGGAGNMANYGSTMNWLANGAGIGGTAGATTAGAGMGGISGVGTFADTGVLELERQSALQAMLDQGYTQEQALAATYRPEQAVSSFNQSGAAPMFQGQQMAGAAGTGAPYTGQTGGVSNVGTLSAGGLTPQAQGVAGAAGAMPWGSPNNVANILQGVTSLAQAAKMPNYQNMADPFNPYRKQYAERLAALEQDPSSITKIPGYEAGLQAVRRSMNARGYSGSGNMMAALAKYGGEFYNRTADRYAQLAGAGVSPVSGAQMGAMGDFSRYNLIRSGLENFGYAGGMASPPRN